MYSTPDTRANLLGCRVSGMGVVLVPVIKLKYKGVLGEKPVFFCVLLLSWSKIVILST
jgi:hypothetical protein